ncbi:MAG: peptidase domain-containing ABC transporter [Stellaceae bacterium]
MTDTVELGDHGESSAAASSLLDALVIVARHRGMHLSEAQLRRDYRIGAAGPSPQELLGIVRASGLRAVVTRFSLTDLMRVGPALPAILLLKNGSAMVLLRVERTAQPPQFVLQDPAAAEDALLILDEQRLSLGWAGDIILVKRDYRLRDEDQPFGLWLVAAQMFRDRRIVRDIAIAAITLSLLALGPIMFWRLLIDRVIYYHSFDTLSVLCVAMLILIIFEAIFGYMRRFLVVHMTARVDTHLTTYMFNKVLNLPLDFFERSSIGVITHDMNEIFKIRIFLTGQVFGTVLDCFVLLVFLPIMFFFSATLTAVVLGFCVLICLWIVAMLPVLRRKSSAVFKAEARKSSFLVETLQGIRTVKSLALDARRRHEWDVRVAETTRLRLDESRTSNIIQTVATPFERLMVSGVFALAVYFAIETNDQVYVGALFAFMMLTQRVASPLIQLSHLLQQYDEAQFAINAIAKLVNQPAEEGRSRAGIRTPLKGRIEFENVRFRYRGSTVPAIDGVSFAAPEGTILGIMGRSGSGKTTVTRLLQMLHSNYEGLIKIDGNDLREFDVDHLRSSLGVVLQDNFLFSGTIREAIAAAKPDASFEEIVYAARLAGAEEFVEHLPRGYETYIQEGSSNLSGGQRQRLAIARALIGNPRILILDEATSALDAESEAIVNANLLRIAKGRTVVIISHRLSVLVKADNVLVLERGRLYDCGRHEELLERCDIYRGLWYQQNQHLQPRPSHGPLPLRAGAAA